MPKSVKDMLRMQSEFGCVSWKIYSVSYLNVKLLKVVFKEERRSFGFIGMKEDELCVKS
jgi:hypothetical protein